MPDYSVHDLARIGMSPKKLDALWRKGIADILDVPDDFELTAIQRNQVSVAKSGRPIIDRDAIVSFLTDIEGQVAYLDYETFAAAIPRFDGYRPFDQIPFQFSLDVVEDGEPDHHEFLFTDPDRPDEAFIAALRSALPATGAVVVWNASFEKTINARLAVRNPSAKEFLNGLNARLIDLEVPFRRQWYVHVGFAGRTSIKRVLPVMVPELSYTSLGIQDGATASDIWNRIVTGHHDPETIRAKRQDLLTYCALDTRAMVEVHRILTRLGKNRRSEPAPTSTRQHR